MKRKDLTKLETSLLHEMACYCCQNEKEFVIFLKSRNCDVQLRLHKRLSTGTGSHLIGKLFTLGPMANVSK